MREILDSLLRETAWAGVTILECWARDERMLRPLTLRAVTSFAVPAKSLKAIEGFTIIRLRCSSLNSKGKDNNNFLMYYHNVIYEFSHKV